MAGMGIPDAPLCAKLMECRQDRGVKAKREHLIPEI